MSSERKPNHYWTLELCKEEANKYKTKVEWRLTSRASFSKANKEGEFRMSGRQKTIING
jgi:hypothetical protein